MLRLAHGIYDQLVTEAFRRVCDDSGLDIECSALDPDVADEALARHVFQLLRAILADQTGRGEAKLTKQLGLVNQIIGVFAQSSPSTNDDGRVTPERLLQVLDTSQRAHGEQAASCNLSRNTTSSSSAACDQRLGADRGLAAVL